VELWGKKLNSNVQQFHQYQQNEQSRLTSNPIVADLFGLFIVPSLLADWVRFIVPTILAD
jgi:hypothetical protein